MAAVDLRTDADVAIGTALVRKVRFRLMAAMALANLAGVLLVISCILWVLPGPSIVLDRRLVVANTITSAVFLFVVCPIGVLWGEVWLRAGRRWLQEGREPTGADVTAVLRSPVQMFLVHATIWLIAAIAFTLVNGLFDVDLINRVGFTTVFGGLTTSAFAYLLTERLIRPIATAAMSVPDLPKLGLPGAFARTLAAWALGTGVPLLGLVIVGLFALIEGESTSTELAVTMLVVGSIGLTVGWWIIVLSARAVSDPLRSLYVGIDRLAQGDFDARVEVYDGSALGQLQAGFNDMVAGLREREMIRDLYGRQVGEEVAEASLEQGSELGGEVCDVAVLFVDVVGSTTLAATRPPEEVVELLNRFFGVVVGAVHAQGGWINKFQGDATLAVFGAPAPVEDPAGSALAAARTIASQLPTEVPELDAGIGVSHGPAVAGRIGSEDRYEFTVIGDPVNEAARLTELAKLYRPMLLASAQTVEAADRAEAAAWQTVGRTELRGRTTETRLAQPLGARLVDTGPVPIAEGRPLAEA